MNTLRSVRLSATPRRFAVAFLALVAGTATALISAAPSRSAGPQAVPAFHVHVRSKPLYVGGHRFIEVLEVRVTGIHGRLRIGCNKCKRVPGHQRFVRLGRTGMRLIRPNWLIDRSRSVQISVTKPGRIGRYIRFGSARSHPNHLVFVGSGCVTVRLLRRDCRAAPPPPTNPTAPTATPTTTIQNPASKGTVNVQSQGSGSINSDPAGIACPTTCSASFDAGTIVALTPVPASGGWTFAGWSGACTGTGACSVAADSATTKTVVATFAPPPPHRVDAYSNYGSATSGHAMCRGNPADSLSMPGGTATQTFTVPSGVKSLDHALIQIDPDNRVNAHLVVYVNGTAQASSDSAAAGDTNFGFGRVGVSPGDQIAVSITFSATYGKIITVYSAAAVGGTLTISNSCPDGATSLTTPYGLRAVVSGWSP